MKFGPLQKKIDENTMDVVDLNDRDAKSEYDFTKERNLEHPVSDCGTLAHLLKSVFGIGVLSMPAAYMYSGLALGLASTVVVAIICAHCDHILVASAQKIYKKNRVPSMSFADTAKEACLLGPNCAKKCAPYARPLVLGGLFISYFLNCSCCAVIIAKNFNYVAAYYLEYEPNLRLTITMLLVPLILLVYVPNLKYLAPVSWVANCFMAVGLGITLYYLVVDIPPISERNWVADIRTFPITFSITIFSIQCIGLLMPMENNMKNPTHFIRWYGVLNQGIIGATVAFAILGFFGYWKYGDQTEGSISLNLPKDEYAAQLVNILIGLAVFCSFGLKFFVCIEIVWDCIKERYANRETLANYVMRTILVTLSVATAIAVPMIIPFVSLVGAFCFSILGLIFPVFVNVFTFWDEGFGTCKWKIFKNIIVVIAGLLALVFGSKLAIQDIISMYTN